MNNQVSESHLATCPAVSGGAWWEGLDEPPVPRTKACLGRLENQGGKADMRQWAAQTPEPVSPGPESVSPESVSPESVSPEPVTPDSVTPEPVTPESVSPGPVSRALGADPPERGPGTRLSGGSTRATASL